MHPKIATLGTNIKSREKINEVYEWFVERIKEYGGSYRTPVLSEISGFLGISDNTLGKHLRRLVGMGLLVVSNPDNKKWRYARYSLPVEGQEADSITEQAVNWRFADEKAEEPDVEQEEPRPEQQEAADDFKPLATLELDGWELVDEKGEKWVRSRELAIHLGYEHERTVNTIYSRHRDFFKEGIDTVDINLMSTDGKEYETRVFSFTGGLKVCRYSEMPKADEVMQQLIDIGDKVRRWEYPAKVSQIGEHIAMWQKALLGDVLQPKFVQIEENITEVRQTAEETRQKAVELESKINVRDDNFQRELAGYRMKLEDTTRRLMEERAERLNMQNERRRQAELRRLYRYGQIYGAMIGNRVEGGGFRWMWKMYIETFGYPYKDTPLDVIPERIERIKNNIIEYSKEHQANYHNLCDADKIFLAFEGVVDFQQLQIKF